MGAWIEKTVARYQFDEEEQDIARHMLRNAPPIEVMLQGDQAADVVDMGLDRVKSSIAGASSADFHRYKTSRRDAGERERKMDEEFEAQVRNLAFLRRRATAASEAAGKTAKRAAKRRKQKEKQIKKQRSK